MIDPVIKAGPTKDKHSFDFFHLRSQTKKITFRNKIMFRIQ